MRKKPTTALLYVASAVLAVAFAAMAAKAGDPTQTRMIAPAAETAAPLEN